MSEHAIPQNIMEYEFKLFAGLTVKQFVFAVIGGAGTYAFLHMSIKHFIPGIFGWPLTLIFAAITLGFTFFNYEKKSLDKWIQDWMRVSATPLIRVWNKAGKPVRLKKGKRYKPEVMPDYLLAYFDVSGNIGSFKKKLQEQLSKVARPKVLNITPQNFKEFSVDNVKIPQIPNTVALLLLDGELPIEGVVAYMRDLNNKVISALKSTKHGIIYFNRPVPDGTYKIEFEHPRYMFPDITITFSQNAYPLFKIMALGKK